MMNPLADAVSAPLVHSLPQASLIAVLLWAGLIGLRGHSARARYRASRAVCVGRGRVAHWTCGSPNRHTVQPLARVAAVVIPITLGGVSAPSATTQAGSVGFEVASIKRNTTDAPSRGRTQPGGRFTAVNMPVILMIRQAYEMLPVQVLNVPDWVTSDGYDIAAKAPDGVDLARGMAPLLRSLLTDRFQFRAHTETRQMPMYELVLARRDRRLGPKLAPAPVDCTAGIAAASPGANVNGRGERPSAPPPSDEPPCAQLGTPGRYVMRGFPMSQFARILGTPVSRPVVDQTGLAGTWNLELEFIPEAMPVVPPGAALPPGVTVPSADAPSLFTALQEQLGLKLRPTRGPVKVLVIDHIARPTED